ncbi:MAG: HAMP domain-containing protein, partial [Acidobacteriota bacterium]|nr:HAMP domain-containing protein [Acidobacteriota bacterium]
ALERIAKSKPPVFDNQTALASWSTWISQSGARVTVIAANGRVLADSAHDIETMENHSNRPEFRQAMATGRGESVRHSHTLDRDLVYWAERFDRPGRAPVVVRFASPLAQIDSALAEVRKRLWKTSLVFLLLAIGISVLYARRFATRIGRLQEFAQRVAEGDFRPFTPDTQTDELGNLARALNRTASRLSATIGSLTDERNRSAAILRSMTEAVAVIDARGRITFCNQAFANIWNIRTVEATAGLAIDEVRHPDVLEWIRIALAGQEASGEISIGTAQPRTFAVMAAPLSLSRGGPDLMEAQAPSSAAGAVLVFHEITGIRRLEQVRKDFVANVSHELRTPLTAIQGFAETLLHGGLEDQQNNRRFVEIIRNHASRLSRLMDDLLKLSRIEAGKLAMDLQAVDVADLIRSNVELAQKAAREKRVSLNAVMPCAGFPPVRGDAGLLREVLRNLVDNAIQYTPAGGRIEISAAQKLGFAVVTVTDTGIGIPQSDQARIFERFYRVDAARSREVGGTGLGLAISRHIVEAHGGEIWVESAVGVGSKFHFSIPLAA